MWAPLRLSLLLYILVGQISCTTVQLISPYDPIIDDRVTSLQEDVTRYFIRLERYAGLPEADHDRYIDFYDDTRVALDLLRVRSQSTDKSEIVTAQLIEMRKMIDDLEELHKIGFNSYGEIVPLKNAFDIAFGSILKLQSALRRGEEN